MPEEKKDVLEFPLEELEVPQAIVLMMQAAVKCAGYGHEITIEDFNAGNGNLEVPIDLERLQQLCEKLEAYVDDKIEAGAAIRTEPVVEDAPNEEAVDESEIFLQNDGDTLNVRGVLYQKACNTKVYDDGVSEVTYCIKQFGHNGLIHEDRFGNER
jgi:hypothetical protein